MIRVGFYVVHYLHVLIGFFKQLAVIVCCYFAVLLYMNTQSHTDIYDRDSIICIVSFTNSGIES